MRYALDGTWWRTGPTLLAGSPLHLFRLGSAGERVADRLEAGDDVDASSLTERLLDAGAIHPRPRASRSFGPSDVTVVTPAYRVAARPGRLTVDDGSEPPIPGAALRLEDNTGPAAARNAGRQLVDTPLIAFVDSDVDLPDDNPSAWLTGLLGHFDDPRVGLVAPRIAGERSSPLDLGAEPGRVRAATRVSYVPAAALVVRTESFDELGGFDEALRLGEDVDFVWRLDEAGWHCRYEPAVTVWHRPRRTLLDRLRQHHGYGCSAADLALRHPRNLAPWHADPATAASWLAVLLGWPGVALALHGLTLRRLDRLLADIPRAEQLRFLALSQVSIAGHLAGALRREWWPVAVIAALASRRARLLFLGAVLWAPRRILTDLAYGTGVWRGSVARRTPAALLPAIHRWRPSTTHRVLRSAS